MDIQIVAAPTTEPAFIGRPAKAADPAPVRIASVDEYAALFGRSAPGAAYGLWDAVCLLFENGGENLWVAPVESDDLPGYLEALGRIEGLGEVVTLLVAPDALFLPRDDYYALARAMIAQAARLGDRFAIVDVHGGGDPASWTGPAALALVADFRAGIPPLAHDGASYGAAYFPWLVPAWEGPGAVPPAAALAGIYATTDLNEGVWDPPANLPLIGITDVTVWLDDGAHQALAVSAADGLSVNAIRAFPGQSVLVWGARTLEGNSQDYRYVHVRRTLIFIAQSVKEGLALFALRPNSAPAWAEAKAMVEDFLTGLWKQGALAGASPTMPSPCAAGSARR
ncbi:MAG TPA: hypothetical protein VGO55_07225 [Allosphingosinicella sp.]|jgi:phage tail sheath protein FI|nr:hypothetical protein [Allosphingosinicella sp.]